MIWYFNVKKSDEKVLETLFKVNNIYCIFKELKIWLYFILEKYLNIFVVCDNEVFQTSY